MAAPLKTCLSKLQKCGLSLSFSRTYARRLKRSVQDVMTPEDDVQKIKHSFADPRKNAYLPFEPNDPVQKMMSKAASSKIIKTNKTSSHNVQQIQEINKAEHNMLTKQSQVSQKPSTASMNSVQKKNNSQKNTDDKVQFERIDEADRRFGRRIMAARGKKDREAHRQIVLEGKNLIMDALSAGAKLKVLYFTRYELIESIPVQFLTNVEIYQVQYKHLKIWSDVDTPQGLLGIFEMPALDKALRPAANPIPLTLVCDSIRDGGNMGTLIRTAAAVGCQRVLVLKGCVDIWNGKVLRSAAGSHYRVPIICDLTWTQLTAFLPSTDNMSVFLADSNQVSEERLQSLQGSQEAVKEIDEIQQVEDELNDSDDEMKSLSENDEDRTEFQREIEDLIDNEDMSYRNFNVLTAYRNAPVGVQSYDHVDYTDKHAVLLISGETAGVSLPARKLAYDHYGTCVNIPMEADVESLNCSVAGSIIMYEIAKQYRNIKNDEKSETVEC